MHGEKGVNKQLKSSEALKVVRSDSEAKVGERGSTKKSTNLKKHVELNLDGREMT